MKDKLRNSALFLASLTLSALLIEGGLRIWSYEQQLQYSSTSRREKIQQPLPGVSYLYPAFASFTQSWPSNPRDYFEPSSNSITYRVNNFGFRDEDFSLPRTEKMRVAFLGDSFCWGNGVKDNDTIDSLMERRLNASAVLNQQFEIYNFCLSGYNTAHQAALYDHVVRHFQPDVLIVWYFLNDINVPPDLYFHWHLSGGGTWLESWRTRSRLIDLAVAPFNRMANHRALLQRVDQAYSKGHPGYESVARNMRRISQTSQQTQVPTVVAIFPWLFHLETERYPFHKPHQVARDLAEQQGLAVLDLFSAFEGRKAEDLWVHPVDQHPNEIGQRIAVQAMVNFLVPRIEQRGKTLIQAAEKRRQTPPQVDVEPGRGWYRAFAKPNEPTQATDTPKLQMDSPG